MKSNLNPQEFTQMDAVQCETINGNDTTAATILSTNYGLNSRVFRRCSEKTSDANRLTVGSLFYRLMVGSLFSGIGGFDLGFTRAGFQVAWQVEIDPFCRKVLARHFSNAQRFEDVQHVGSRELAPVQIICAGVPCQDVSVAGKRAGLAGERTGLFYEFARILQELRPAWFVFENVPGLFSSNGGRDFAEVLRVLMVECGYGVSWRVLNSQFFGVAQRRRRVFIVGCFGKPCPAEILFESESGTGNPKACGETGQDIAFALAASVRGTGDGHGNAWNSNYVAGTLKQRGRGACDEVMDNPQIANSITGGTGRVGSRGADDGANIVARTITGTCHKRHDTDTDTYIAATLRESDGHHGRSSPRGDGCDNLIAAPLSAGSHDRSHQPGRNFAGSGRGNDGVGTAILTAPTYSDGVRDFAGLPEWMDSARYRALGNAVTVNVAEWIARRILQWEAAHE